MRLTRIFLALIFCTTLFTSCSVDEIEDDTPINQIEDAQATGDGDNEVDDEKGNG